MPRCRFPTGFTVDSNLIALKIHSDAVWHRNAAMIWPAAGAKGGCAQPKANEALRLSACGQCGPVQAKPVQAKPVQAKPVQAKPVQANAVQANAVQANAVQANAVQANAVQAKPCADQALRWRMSRHTFGQRHSRKARHDRCTLPPV